MYTIKQASDSFNTFYQVYLNEVICFQAGEFDSCISYVNDHSNQLDKIELSKCTVSLSSKLNISLCLDLNTNVYDKEQALELDYQGTLTFWLDNEAEHEGDAIYKLYRTTKGFTAVLWEVWTKDKVEAFPESFEGDKGLQDALRVIHKNK